MVSAGTANSYNLQNSSSYLSDAGSCLSDDKKKRRDTFLISNRVDLDSMQRYRLTVLIQPDDEMESCVKFTISEHGMRMPLNIMESPSNDGRVEEKLEFILKE